MIYEIIEDFRVLTESEIVEKYSNLGQDAVCQALRELSQLRSRGILCDHEPVVSDRIRFVNSEGQVSAFGEFLRDNPSTLVLGLTEQCNLRCEYCCFGEHYSRFRGHRAVTMSREVAELAIAQFLDRSSGSYSGISFYGGEPFLEWDLLEHIVRFAEDYGHRVGKTPSFSVTTNGTLLTEERMHFIVEHNIAVQISIDGPKESHDRYRVFRCDGKHSRKRVGSFDVIMRNIRRWIELYPEYKNRGILTVMAPPLDLEGLADLIMDLYQFFPRSRVSLVQDGYEDTFWQEGIRVPQSGCAPAASCSTCDGCTSVGISSALGTAEFVELQLPSFERGENSGSCNIEQVQRQGVHDRLPVLDKRQLRSAMRQYQDGKIRHGNMLWKESPFVDSLFREDFNKLHRRVVTDKPMAWTFTDGCFPGHLRLFCSPGGQYYSCERVEMNDALALGDVWTGFEPARAVGVSEIFRHLGDCGNCIVQKTCSACLTSIQIRGDGSINGPAYEYECQRRRRALPFVLKCYTEIMEENPQAFDHRYGESLPTFLANTRFAGSFEDRGGESLGVEELVERASPAQDV